MTKLHLVTLMVLVLSCTPSSKPNDNKEITTDKEIPLLENEKNTEEIKVDQVGLIPPPIDYFRTEIEKKSFADYLRNLPLKMDNNNVYLYDGTLKYDQTAQYRVIKMDVGDKDLQQCADAVMRLRAEYLFAQKKYEDIHFNFTSGDEAKWISYAQGYRSKITGNKVSWNKVSNEDYSYENFRKYMNLVFNYAGTFSLSKELDKVTNPTDIKAGDVFIYGGFPGHAIIVLDIALHKTTNEKIFLLAQSYMPAQEIHVLQNPFDDTLSPWYKIPEYGELYTPEWTFDISELKTF